MIPATCADPTCHVPCDGHCPRVTGYCAVCGRCVDIGSLFDLGALGLKSKKRKASPEKQEGLPRRARAIGVCGHQLGASESEKTGSCLAITEGNIRLVRLVQERARADLR